MATTLTIRFKSVMAGLRQTRKRYKASDHLREHIARFNKSAPEMVKIDPKLNDFMMSRVVKGGDKVKVEVSKTGDIINAKLAPGQVAAAPTIPAQTSATPKAADAKPAKPAEKAPAKAQSRQETKAPEQKPKQEKQQAKPEKQEHKQSSPSKPTAPAQS